MSRPVILPDGTVYSNVPNSVTDQEVLEKHLKAKRLGISASPVKPDQPKPKLTIPKEEGEEVVPEAPAPVKPRVPALVETKEEDTGIATDIVRGLTEYGKFVHCNLNPRS